MIESVAYVTQISAYKLVSDNISGIDNCVPSRFPLQISGVKLNIDDQCRDRVRQLNRAGRITLSGIKLVDRLQAFATSLLDLYLHDLRRNGVGCAFLVKEYQNSYQSFFRQVVYAV